MQRPVSRYEQWQRARLAEIEEQRRLEETRVEDEDRVLTGWADVRLADLEAEEGQAEAALAELIADVDAEAQAEGGQKDPLGILQKPIASSLPGKQKPQSAASQHGDIRTPARLGAAAAAQMKALWYHVSNNSADPRQLDRSEQKQLKGAGSVEGGGELLRDVLNAAHLTSGGSISADSHDFSPIMFLSQVHSQSSLEQLQRGLTHLQRSVNNRAAALKALVADHYGQYVSALDTIEHLEQLMAAEVGDKGSSRAQRIRQQLDQLNKQCFDAYEPVIQRKAGGERMRQTLGTMTQYRFLFGLPGEVAQYASSRQFAQVVRAYKKAKGINITTTLTTEATIADDGKRDNVASSKLNKAAAGPQQQQHQQSQQAGELPSLVLAEVFRVISTVRAALFHQLERADVPLDEQAEAIAHLRELDADIDPLWYFLHRQAVYTNQLMRRAVVAFVDNVHATRTEGSQQRLEGEQLIDGGPDEELQQLHSASRGRTVAMQLPSGAALDGSSISQTFSSQSAQLSLPPWNRFGSALLANPVFISSLPHSLVDAAEWAQLLPASVQLSASVDESSAALLPSLITRLCDILSHGVSNLLTLARLTSAPQSSPSMPAATAAASAPLSSTSYTTSFALAAQPGLSSIPSVLSSLDDSSRRGIESLLHSVFAHFAAYVRLVVFPLTPTVVRGWSSDRSDGASPPGVPSDRQPSVVPNSPVASHSLSSPSAASQRLQLPSSQHSRQSAANTLTALDKSSEHQPFSMEILHQAGTDLPLILPEETDNELPVPAVLNSVVRQLLPLHSQLIDTQLPSFILEPFTELRKDIVRSYAQQHVRHVQVAVRSLAEAEDWKLCTRKQMQQAVQARSAVTRREYRGSGRPHRSPTTTEANGDTAADCSSLRITGLPAAFSSLFLSTVESLTAIPSFKPVWLIKLVVGPMLDTMRTFATAEQAAANECAQQHLDGQTSESLPVSLRLLLVLANVRYTRLQLLPPLLASLLALFPQTTHSLLRAAHLQSVLPAYEEAETAALHHFIRLQLTHMHQHIAQRAYNHHALSEHINAHNSRSSSHVSIRPPLPSSPLRTRGCIVAACLHLVAVHAQLFLVCGHAADEVTNRAMRAMLTGTLQSITISLQQLQHRASRQEEDEGASVEHDGMEDEGSGQVSLWSRDSSVVPLIALEVSFIHTVLSPFSTDDSIAAQQHVEQLLVGWQQDNVSGNGNSHTDQAAAIVRLQADVSKQLKTDLARTQLMFAAFQRSSGNQQAPLHNGHTRADKGSRQLHEPHLADDMDDAAAADDDDDERDDGEVLDDDLEDEQ